MFHTFLGNTFPHITASSVWIIALVVGVSGFIVVVCISAVVACLWRRRRKRRRITNVEPMDREEMKDRGKDYAASTLIFKSESGGKMGIFFDTGMLLTPGGVDTDRERGESDEYEDGGDLEDRSRDLEGASEEENLHEM